MFSLGIGGWDPMVNRLQRVAMDESVGGQSHQGKYKTDQKIKLPQHKSTLSTMMSRAVISVFRDETSEIVRGMASDENIDIA